MEDRHLEILTYILFIGVDLGIDLFLLVSIINKLLSHDYLLAGILAFILVLVGIASIMWFKLLKESS